MQSRVAASWICPNCANLDLPFANTSNDSIELGNEVPPSPRDHTEYLEKDHHHTSIAHLNTQSILSTFTEFTLMLSLYKYVLLKHG